MPRIYLSPPHLTGRELELVKDAIDSNWVAPLGPHVDAFEEELAAQAGVGHALALSSGTAALHLALVVLGVQAGDEVACSSLTFSASANPIHYVGAAPVFVDAAGTWTMDPDLLERALTEREIRAVVAVDLYGQCCDYDRVREVCARHGALLLQDAAESLGATYKGQSAGGQGDITAFSFNGNKVITTSGGGALLSSDSDKVEHARKPRRRPRAGAPLQAHRARVQLTASRISSPPSAGLSSKRCRSGSPHAAASASAIASCCPASSSCPRPATGPATAG